MIYVTASNSYAPENPLKAPSAQTVTLRPFRSARRSLTTQNNNSNSSPPPHLRSTQSEQRVVRLAKIGFIAGVGIVLNAFTTNLQSDTPVYESETNFITACYTQILLSLGIGLTLSRAIFKLPGPSCMSIATETR